LAWWPVQFLSMKLAAVNPQLDFHLESLLHKEVCRCPLVILDSIT
jgi:hypothetical protein